MQNNLSKEMYEKLETYKKQAEELRTGIAVFSEIREENLDYKEKADSLERFIKKFERELSITLFKYAIVQGIINREEESRETKGNSY